MNRRGFLKLAGMAVPAGIALASLPVDGFDALIYQPDLPVINDGPINIVDFRTMVQRVQVAMAKAMPYPVQSVMNEPERFIGHQTMVYGRPVTFAHQFNVGAAGGSIYRLEHGGEVAGANLDFIGASLAASAERTGVNVFGALPLPYGVGEAANVATASGPTVRGVILYDVNTDGMIYRFDALGGRA